jgi:hypothetical protein
VATDLESLAEVLRAMGRTDAAAAAEQRAAAIRGKAKSTS